MENDIIFQGRTPVSELDKLVAKRVRLWGKKTKNALLLQLASLGVHDQVRMASRIRYQRRADGSVRTQQEKPLRDSIVFSLKKSRGEVQRVNFSFSRHGIFYEIGVGKNRPKGSPASREAASPWLTPVLNGYAIEELADILEEVYGDIAVHSVRLLIPGIIDFKSENDRLPVSLDDGRQVNIVIDRSFF